MAILALAIPIAPGKTDEWRQFIAQLNGARKAEYKASRNRMGIREWAFFQQTPHGDLVVLVLEGDDPARAFAQFGEGNDAFTEWMVAEVKKVHDFDLRQPPPGPLPELVVDSHG
jgi:hypothetical protein